jgi:hypothetical protein
VIVVREPSRGREAALGAETGQGSPIKFLLQPGNVAGKIHDGNSIAYYRGLFCIRLWIRRFIQVFSREITGK